MRILSHFKTLVYYDGTQLFVARDQLNVSYLCLLAEQMDGSDKYLCIPVSNWRLDDFVAGKIDLESIMKEPETAERFAGTVTKGDFERIPTEAMSEVPVDWMPETGFFMKPEPVMDRIVIQESQQRQRAIIHCTLNPPEAREHPKIAAERLAQAVKVLQRVVSHAFKKAVRDLDAATREAINRAENYQLEVFAFSPGSFTLHMQTAAPANMLGYSEVARALSIIDIVSSSISSPEAAVQYIAGYGGHFAVAYRDLLQFIVENETPLSYEWSMPDRTYTTVIRISDKQAKPVYSALIQRADIGVEEKRIVGKLTKVDTKRGSWRLESDWDKADYSGKSDMDLGGLVADARYEFLCEERLAEERGTGKEIVELHLKNYRPMP